MSLVRKRRDKYQYTRFNRSKESHGRNGNNGEVCSKVGSKSVNQAKESKLE